ncbi:hypothetical protein AVEN_63668-1 [Araneus ventricosus]|uniref:Uncharacterized protein n=1 Tax=Araneus ventricosus TaxID=182803 RepID=A0A4Y2UM84_ARAVE|nr:hypothetical protein AVEN_63668-1 [Araneus ventricosus]
MCRAWSIMMDVLFGLVKEGIIGRLIHARNQTRTAFFTHHPGLLRRILTIQSHPAFDASANRKEHRLCLMTAPEIDQICVELHSISQESLVLECAEK